MKKHGKYFLAIVILGLVYIFVFKSQWLTLSIYQNLSFPLGTLVSWVLIFSFSFFLYLGIPLKTMNPVEKFMKIALKFVVFMAAFWGFFSFLIAKNWAFVFKNITGFYIWGIYTAFIVLIPIVVFVIVVFRRITGRYSNRGNNLKNL